MFVINDNDFPITVAEKIVKGTKENKNPISNSIFGKAETDMYSIEEIKEIADYLMVYFNNHENGD